MTTPEKIILLVKSSPYHAAIIGSMMINQSEEILKDEETFLKENKDNVISPNLIIAVAKDCIAKLKT